MIVTFETKRAINISALSHTLRALVPTIAGITVVGDMADGRRCLAAQVEVVLTAPLTPADDTAIRNAIAAHNASTLTAEQEAQDEGEADRDALRQAKAAAALDQLADDLAAVDTADVAALRAILRRTLQRQRGIIRALRQVV